MLSKLYEYRSFDNAKMVIENITEGDKRNLYMKGIFIQGDVRNQNQRVYPLNEITKAVKNVVEKIQHGYSVLGELDHPEELSINLDRVSHMITEMWIDGADGYGKLKILPTGPGNIAKTLLENGVKLGVSSRGSGNVSHGGSVSDYDIVTVDIVAQPSAPDAYPKAIYESLFNMRGGQILHNIAQAAVYDKAAQKYLEKDIIKFITELNKK